MRIGFYQFAPIFGDTSKNVERMAKMLEGLSGSQGNSQGKANGADLIVAPELATSGYLFLEKSEVEKVADTVPGYATERLQEAAAKSNCGIVFGMPERKGDKIYNSAVFVDGSRVVAVYRKVHLFDKEKLFFAPGEEGFEVVEYRGAKLGLLVCFDHMFPEAARTLALQGAEIICHPSNLVLPEYGQLTTRVRSIENKVFWILSNRYGTENRGGRALTYTGVSQILAPGGKVLKKAPEKGDSLMIVDVSPEDARSKRIAEMNDLFGDRKPELYRL